MANTTQVSQAAGTSAVTLPESLQQALQNRFTSEELDAFFNSSVRPSFLYGSLMLPSSVSTLAGRFDIESISKNMTPAVLYGHQRYAIGGVDFPAVLATMDPGDTVSGLLLFGLSQMERGCIDSYEGELYKSEQVQVEIQLADGTTRRVEADVYIWDGPWEDLFAVEEKLWTIEGWLEGRTNNESTSNERGKS